MKVTDEEERRARIPKRDRSENSEWPRAAQPAPTLRGRLVQSQPTGLHRAPAALDLRQQVEGRGWDSHTGTNGTVWVAGICGQGCGQARRKEATSKGSGPAGQQQGRTGMRSGCPVPASVKGRETCRSNTAPWCRRRATADLLVQVAERPKATCRISPHPLDSQKGIPGPPTSWASSMPTLAKTCHCSCHTSLSYRGCVEGHVCPRGRSTQCNNSFTHLTRHSEDPGDRILSLFCPSLFP